MVIAVGKSEDNTLGLIESIKSDKIKIFHRVWDDSKRENGEVLSIETNYALSKIRGQWGFYLQADEVLHEEDRGIILRDLKRAEAKNREAVSFKYLHFKGDYWSLNPWAYRREIRLVKNLPSIRSIGDACTFKRDDGKPPKTYASPAHIYHYGWVKKPETMVAKTKGMDYMYHDDAYLEKKFAEVNEKNIFEEVKVLREFAGEHPAVMLDKIKAFPKIPRLKKRWQYLDFYKKVLKYGWW